MASTVKTKQGQTKQTHPNETAGRVSPILCRGKNDKSENTSTGKPKQSRRKSCIPRINSDIIQHEITDQFGKALTITEDNEKVSFLLTFYSW